MIQGFCGIVVLIYVVLGVFTFWCRGWFSASWVVLSGVLDLEMFGVAVLLGFGLLNIVVWVWLGLKVVA